MDIVLFGIQGSGKGTQARKLAEEFGYDIFEAGGELRSIAASSTELGGIVRSYVDEGNLVPHDIIMRIVREAVFARPSHQKILFDGVPRDLDQMRDFDRIMQDAKRPFRCVHLLVDENEAFQRLLHRSSMENRTDDGSTEKIQRRMRLFHEKTLPVIEAYRHGGNMVPINGDGSIDEVYPRLRDAVSMQ
ncbi:hypothetical protein A2635_02060 [Candidatus Peribacteria bacterium RIFCSPHIGHO2_01_FULL_51_9]|nr:MAG: hypothetical protein A2635_02060 [Candidatus Peribacteria bacterium RIFCSPHIGHO2_01_FULL_51_9]